MYTHVVYVILRNVAAFGKSCTLNYVLPFLQKNIFPNRGVRCWSVIFGALFTNKHCYILKQKRLATQAHT